MGSSDPLRAVRVERIVPLDPTMVRVTFAAVDGSIPDEVRIPAGHCRLFFPDARDPTRRWPRVFTYRRWHANGSFDVDFALHSGTGPAALWIACATLGDSLGWKHGGGPKLRLEAAPSGPLFAFGDATALPVISALLERAHPLLTGHVILDLPGAAYPATLAAPPRVSVRHLGDAIPSEAAAIMRALDNAAPAMVFVACEAGRMRHLRRIALDELRLPRERVFTSGYWKAGLSTEEVELAKQRPDWFGDASSTASGEPVRQA